MKRSLFFRYLSLALGGTPFACGGGDHPPPALPYGTVAIAVASAPDVARVHFRVTGPGMDPAEFDLFRDSSNNTVTGLVAVRAGPSRRFAATAYDAMNVVNYVGTATISVPANVTTNLTITLLSVSGGAPLGNVAVDVNFNHAPIIAFVSVSPNPGRRNRDVALSVGASDPDGDPISYLWTVTDANGAPAGALTNGAAANAAWRAPNANGAYTATIRVSDITNGVAIVPIQFQIGN